MAALVISAPIASAQDEMTVSIQDFFFDPDQMTVAPGTTVTWVNEGQAPHTVTSTDGKDLDSGTLKPGDSYTFTFKDSDAGETYAYHCEIHPQMTATVKVSGSAAATSSASASASAPQDLAETGGVSLPQVAAFALVSLGILAAVAMRGAS